MTSKPEEQVITVGRYSLAAPWAEYVTATEALIRRAEQDGVPGVSLPSRKPDGWLSVR